MGVESLVPQSSRGQQERSETRDARTDVPEIEVADFVRQRWRFQSLLNESLLPGEVDGIRSTAMLSSSGRDDAGALPRRSLSIAGQAIPSGPDPLPRLPRGRERRSASISSERWEGVVLGVESDVFRARLVDLDRRTPDEEAEIHLSEVSDEDRALVEPGAIFYWSVGYYTDRTGQRMRRSLVRFRRLPAWTRRELDDARREAEETGRILGWGSESANAARTR